MPEKTGRVVVTLFEIYETEDGLHHHWIESKDIHLLAEDWLKEVGGEITVHTHQTIIQSLWDWSTKESLISDPHPLPPGGAKWTRLLILGLRVAFMSHRQL